MTANLKSTYLGLELDNPLVASAGPMTRTLESLQHLEQAGIAAVVLTSLFEEQIARDEQRIHSMYEYQSYTTAESLSYFPEMEDYHVGPGDYLRLLESAKQSLRIPVIGSLNGYSTGGWISYAKQFQDAGADAVELNVYFVPTDPQETAASVEARYVDLVSEVSSSVSVPIAVKLGAQFSCLPNFAKNLKDAGARGVVLFNRYLEPDIDLHSLQVTPQLLLSQRHEIRLCMRWIAILRDQLSISIAATSGIHCAEDAIKLLLVGADVCMMTSVLLKQGTGVVPTMLQDLRDWLDVNEYKSVEQLRGSLSYANSPDSGLWERANYMKAIVSYSSVR